MKKITTVTLLICYALTMSYAQEIKAPKEGGAVVYFMRIGAGEFAINFSYYDNNKFIGKFNGPKYMRYDCESGEHLFWVNLSGIRDFITAELEPGKIYFIEVKPTINVISSEWQLVPVDPKDVKKLSKIEKLIAKRPSESFSEDELKIETQNQRDEISAAIVKHQENTKKGKKVLHLEKDMFYTNTGQDLSESK